MSGRETSKGSSVGEGTGMTPAEMAKIRKILSDPKALAEINRDIDADLALGAKIHSRRNADDHREQSGGGEAVSHQGRYPVRTILKQLINSLPVK